MEEGGGGHAPIIGGVGSAGQDQPQTLRDRSRPAGSVKVPEPTLHRSGLTGADQFGGLDGPGGVTPTGPSGPLLSRSEVVETAATGRHCLRGTKVSAAVSGDEMQRLVERKESEEGGTSFLWNSTGLPPCRRD